MHTRAADDAIASVIVGVEGLDESGTSTVDGLHGDVGVAEQRRNEAVRRRTAAIQAALNKIKPLSKPPVSAAALASDQEAVKALKGIAMKTAGKVATDAHSFDLFVSEQQLQFDEGMRVHTSFSKFWAAWVQI